MANIRAFTAMQKYFLMMFFLFLKSLRGSDHFLHRLSAHNNAKEGYTGSHQEFYLQLQKVSLVKVVEIYIYSWSRGTYIRDKFRPENRLKCHPILGKSGQKCHNMYIKAKFESPKHLQQTTN